MQQANQSYSTVSAIVPRPAANEVIDAICERDNASVLVWKARGTLVKDHWRRSWLPAVSPARVMLQMLVPDPEVESVVATVVQRSRLDLQATGAVFSSPCQQTYFGSAFKAWPVSEALAGSRQEVALKNSLNAIFCIVGHASSDRVTRAAMDAGAHGPVVYYCEGRGLRDRVGWLRITKEAEKEVLMVMVDDADVEEVFDAMAKAGGLHLPGRGFMYRVPISAGLYNLPSRVSHHHYEANMQQVINAIDHLTGHTHWRDQGVFELGQARGSGIELQSNQGAVLEDQRCLTAIVDRDDLQLMMDILLVAGAPGLNLNHSRCIRKPSESESAGTKVAHEYSILRCITSAGLAEQICAHVSESARSAELHDVCMLVNEVPKVATYVPGNKNYRRQSAA